MKRILIGGTNSGCGKTTVTCALLKALAERGERVSSFKCGPDYIDPMFHKKVIGIASHNLDSFFCDDNTLNFLLAEYSSDISVIEGVMGFYDGVNGRGSAHSLCEITQTPAVLVINCRGMSESMGAVVSGFLNYRKNNISGFVFNGLPERLEPLAERLCAELETDYLGFFPQCDFSFGSRHLGLVTADEISDISEKLKRLGELAERHLRIDRLLELAESEPPSFSSPEIKMPSFSAPPVIAVASDGAFCFQYSENLELLKRLGCELRFFSPVEDSKVPECDGLLLCGGYPELYARRLSDNESMRSSLRERILRGTPTIAECGGFMYLHERFSDCNGEFFSGVGVISGSAFKTEKLRRFGYVTLTARRGNLLCGEGESLKAHEFHYWDSGNAGADFFAEKADGRAWSCCHGTENLYAGFPHIYFYSDIRLAERFVKKTAEFGGKA